MASESTMASESAGRGAATLSGAARLGLDAGLAVVCLGVVGFGLQLHAGIDFGPTAGWIAVAGVVLGTVLLSAVAVHRSASATAVRDPDPVVAWVAALGPAVAGAWTLLVFAPTVEWLYPPPRWVIPTLLALPTAVLCGTAGDLLSRASRGLSLEAYGERPVAVPVLSMLVAVLLFGASLPDGLWLDTVFSADPVGTGLPFAGALFAGAVGTVTAGRQVVGTAGDDWRTTLAVGIGRVAAGTLVVVYVLVVVAALLVGILLLNPFSLLVGLHSASLGLLGVALAVLTALGVEILGLAFAPLPTAVARLRQAGGESVEPPSTASAVDTARAVVAGAVGGLAGFACCAFGLFHVATLLGAPGGVAGVASVVVVTGSVCVGALGGRRLTGWLRAQLR
jgi:hypothetical protein